MNDDSSIIWQLPGQWLMYLLILGSFIHMFLYIRSRNSLISQIFILLNNNKNVFILYVNSRQIVHFLDVFWFRHLCSSNFATFGWNPAVVTMDRFVQLKLRQRLACCSPLSGQHCNSSSSQNWEVAAAADWAYYLAETETKHNEWKTRS